MLSVQKVQNFMHIVKYSGGSIDINHGVNFRVSKVKKYVENPNLWGKEIEFRGEIQN